MEKSFQSQKPISIDQLFESTKKLIVENLELRSTAKSESMLSYYEGIAVGAYFLFLSFSSSISPEYQELSNMIDSISYQEVGA